MTDNWDIRVEVPANGQVRKRSTVRALREGKVEFADEVNVMKATDREELAGKLAELTGEDADGLAKLLLALFDDAMRRREAATNAAPPPDLDPEAKSARLLKDTPADIKAEAEDLLHNPDLIERVSADVARQGVAGEGNLTATLYAVYSSRKLRRPLAARVRGPSTSGKSFVIDSTALLMPPEAVIFATQMTPQSLFHMKPGSLRHRLIVAGERSRSQEDEAAEATRALREMLSAGRLSKLIPLKQGNVIGTVLIEQEGPIAFVESTTQGEVFAEDENRALALYTDEQPEQTRRVLSTLAERAADPSAASAAGRVQLVHHAAQRLLERREVVIPYAPRIAAKLSADRVEARRAFAAVLSMIEALCLLYQFQRECDGDGRLIADPDDYRTAVTLLAEPMRRQLGGGIPEPARRFAGRLYDWFEDGEFTTRQAKAKEVTSRASVYVWLSDLRSAGVVEQVEAARGSKGARYRVLPPGAWPAEAAALPDAKAVFG
jgi:hypothetical protein